MPYKCRFEEKDEESLMASMKSLVKDESQDIISKRKNKKNLNQENTNYIREISNISSLKKLNQNEYNKDK
jgi:hypothetical protein